MDVNEGEEEMNVDEDECDEIYECG